MTKFIVTAVDISDTSDCKPRVLKVCDSKNDAQAYVKSDIEDWVNEHSDTNVIFDFDEMTASYADDDIGCEWNIDEVEIK